MRSSRCGFTAVRNKEKVSIPSSPSLKSHPLFGDRIGRDRLPLVLAVATHYCAVALIHFSDLPLYEPSNIDGSSQVKVPDHHRFDLTILIRYSTIA